MPFEVPEEMVARLEKGDSISRAEIEPLIPAYEDDGELRLFLLGWMSVLRRRLKKVGKHFTVRLMERGSAVRVLVDSEAMDFNKRDFNSSLRRAERRHENLAHVDPANLDREQRQTLTRSLNIQGTILASISEASDRAKREMSLDPCVRRVPVLR